MHSQHSHHSPFSDLLPPEAAATARETLERIKRDPSKHFQLPRAIRERGGNFVCFVSLQAKKGRGSEMLAMMNAVHHETDEVEFEVYSHRVLRGKDEDDRDSFCVVIEYDTPESFFRHYQGRAITNFYRSDILELPPKLNFCLDVETM